MIAQEKTYSLVCDKFINLLMIDGKKIKASTLFFDMLYFLKKKLIVSNDKKIITHSNINIGNFILIAIENVQPHVEVKKVRVAGNIYLVPSILSKKKQQALAIRWIIEAARKRKKNSPLSFSQSLAEEIFDALRKQGTALQKRDELHRLAEVNRAYIRYRWW